MTTVIEQLERFKKVVANRTTAEDIIGLYKKLSESTKFSEDIKPDCFEYLLPVSLKIVPDAQLKVLANELYKYNVLEYLQNEVDAYSVRDLFVMLARRLMTSAKSDADYTYWARFFLETGAAYNIEELSDLLHFGNMDETTIENIAQATKDVYIDRYAEELA